MNAGLRIPVIMDCRLHSSSRNWRYINDARSSRRGVAIAGRIRPRDPTDEDPSFNAGAIVQFF
jgi:hypothetical protein